MTKEIAFDDAEIAALLDELEAEQNRMTAAAAPTLINPHKEVTHSEPAPCVLKEPEPKLEPTPVAEPEPIQAPEEVPNAKTVAAMNEARKKSAAKPTAKSKPVETTLVVEVKPTPEMESLLERAEQVAATMASSESVEEPELASLPDTPQTSDKASKLNFYVDVNQFNRDTKLTEATLDNAMMEQSGLRAFYGSQAAQAEAQHARLKVRFDVLEAKLYDEHRKALAAGTEKVTEKMVENAVKLDPRWVKGKNTVIEADTIAAINKSLGVALADRKDMLVQLGADRREEFKGSARIMAAQDERETIAERAKAAYKNGRGVQ